MSGKIYTICRNGEPVYVGFTIKSIEQRWADHVSNCKHSKCALHRAMRKYGVANFSVQLVAEHNDAEFALNTLEPMYIAAFGTHVSQNGYNMTWGGERPPSWQGKKHSPETIAKIAAGNKGKNKGRKHSPETIAKRSAACKGRKLSAEHRAKIAAANRNRSPETRAKFVAAAANPSPETRAKISAAAKERWAMWRQQKLVIANKEI